MRKFVEQDRGEEKKRRHEADDPVVERPLARVLLRKISGGQTPRHEQKNHQPGVIDLDLYSGDPEQLNGFRLA
jgi:hypothetical protein